MLMTIYERILTIVFVFTLLYNVLGCCPGLCHLYLGTKADTLVPAYDAQAHVKGKRDFVSKHELVTSN